MNWVKIQTFLKSLIFHVHAGLPKASQSVINDRYSLCVICEEFDRKQSQCGVCGCNISNKKIFLNKLAWADQSCPLNKWGKINK